MALFLEYSNTTQSRKVTIPKKQSEKLAAYKDGFEAYLSKGVDLNMLPGGGVVKRLSSGVAYGEKDGNKKKNGKEETPKTMTATDATTFLSRMNKSLNKFTPDSPKNAVYNSPAGKLVKDIAKGVIKTANSMSKQVQAVKPPSPTAAKSSVKPPEIKTKEISTPNGKISYTIASENKNIDTKKVYITEEQLENLAYGVK